MSTPQVWLAQLRRLDQAHAPNLPIHVDVLTLELSELRDIVITAVRAMRIVSMETLVEMPRGITMKHSSD